MNRCKILEPLIDQDWRAVVGGALYLEETKKGTHYVKKLCIDTGYTLMRAAGDLPAG